MSKASVAVKIKLKQKNLFACDKLKSASKDVEIGQSPDLVTTVLTFQLRLRTDLCSTVSLEEITVFFQMLRNKSPLILIIVKSLPNGKLPWMQKFLQFVK